jgi:hypothetical protein
LLETKSGSVVGERAGGNAKPNFLFALAGVAWLGAIVLVYMKRGRHAKPNVTPALCGGRAFVRTRRAWQASWVTWHPRFGGGPQLVVEPGRFEVVAPPGMMLESRDLIIESEKATIWRDTVGVWGTAIDRRPCIHMEAPDPRGGRLELAVSPTGSLDDAWEALLESGVSQP